MMTLNNCGHFAGFHGSDLMNFIVVVSGFILFQLF